MNNNTTFFKRIVDECFYKLNPMHHDTFHELVKRDENKKKFMQVLLKYRRIEVKFHIKIEDNSVKSMNACIVKEIYRNDKLISTVYINWDDIDIDFDEDAASYEMEVADILESYLEEHSDEDCKLVA